jgi:hypothetical protein
MNRAYHIIGKTRVFFVFTNFSGNGVPKGDNGEEIFNVNHTERSECGVAEMIYRFTSIYISFINDLLYGVYAK